MNLVIIGVLFYVLEDQKHSQRDALTKGSTTACSYVVWVLCSKCLHVLCKSPFHENTSDRLFLQVDWDKLYVAYTYIVHYILYYVLFCWFGIYFVKMLPNFSVSSSVIEHNGSGIFLNFLSRSLLSCVSFRTESGSTQHWFIAQKSRKTNQEKNCCWNIF